MRSLKNQTEDGVCDRADRRKVIEGDERVHLELSREQSLDHDKSGRLEKDANHLVNDADDNKLDLANRSNDNTHDYDADIAENFQTRICQFEHPSGEQDRNGSTSLEHLDEGNTQVEVGHVAANQ